jgi:spoIIIJ-associated protein
MDYIEFTAKTVDDAITKASLELGIPSTELNYEVVEKGSTGFIGLGKKEAMIRVSVKKSVEDIIKDFLSQVFEAMGIETEIIISKGDEENSINVDLKGNDMGVLIGKRGQTLDALQYLTNLAVNKKSDVYYRIKIDTEDYRKRRQQTLENLAKNISYKVKKTRKPVSLEPMNPFERRVIHSALQNDRYVTTHSEGEEPYRHVVVTLKR